VSQQWVRVTARQLPLSQQQKSTRLTMATAMTLRQRLRCRQRLLPAPGLSSIRQPKRNPRPMKNPALEPGFSLSCATDERKWPCLLWVIFDRDEASCRPRYVGYAPESGSKQDIGICRDGPLWVDGVARRVIQAPKPEPRTIRSGRNARYSGVRGMFLRSSSLSRMSPGHVRGGSLRTRRSPRMLEARD
jgi:hypothetical protein